MLLRTKVWTLALTLAFVCSIGWIFIPGECTVQPVGTPDNMLRGSVFSTLVSPFAFDWVYLVNFLLKLSPILLVLLAAFHWARKFEKLRAVAAMFAMALSAGVALHPYRDFSDIGLIIVVSAWGIIVLVAYESHASPGSALLALISIELLISEVYSGLGVYRGLPFWVLVVCLAIVFSYGIFHYTRMLRHRVLGRYTAVHEIGKDAVEYLRALDLQRDRLDEEQMTK